MRASGRDTSAPVILGFIALCLLGLGLTQCKTLERKADIDGSRHSGPGPAGPAPLPPPPSSRGLNDVTTCTPPKPVKESDVNTAYDLTYAVMGGHTLKLDIAYPKEGANHPLVILVHGGGFTTGDKSTTRRDLLMLAGQGYAVASINYRLALDQKTRFPAQIQDLRCAVRWLRSQASTYAIDPSRVAAEGDSAGGTLVSLLGTAGDVPEFDSADCSVAPSAQPTKITAVIGNAGRADLRVEPDVTPVAAYPIIISLLGFDPRLEPGAATDDLIKLASPLTHVTSDSVPFLLIHGQLDPLVLSVQYEDFSAALKAVGVPVAFINDTQWQHAPPIFSPDPVYRHALCTSLNFLSGQLSP